MANKENVTIFGQETEFDGVLEFTDNLVITGKFKGSIKSGGALEIDKSAVCNVDKISAESIVVSGNVTGNIEGNERVELCSGSRMKGDIKTARLRIADDVEFEGQISMVDKIPDVDLFSVASAEYKNALFTKSADLH